MLNNDSLLARTAAELKIARVALRKVAKAHHCGMEYCKADEVANTAREGLKRMAKVRS